MIHMQQQVLLLWVETVVQEVRVETVVTVQLEQTILVVLEEWVVLVEQVQQH